MLSVWYIEDDESNLPRVVAALASGRQHIDKLDCALIDEPDLLRLGIQIEPAPESCADKGASEEWHRNLVRLTASNLNALVTLIREHARRQRIKRFYDDDVMRLLEDGLTANRIDRSLLKYPSLLESLARAKGTSDAT